MSDARPHYFLPQWIQPSDRTLIADVCIYGGTAAGVIAAVAVARAGKKPLILQPGGFIGGMTTGGLGETDFGDKSVIHGLSRQFYRDLGRHYGRDEEWKFEPSAARAILERYLKQHDIPVYSFCYLAETELDADKRIVSIRTLGGLRVRARMFIDATYEGDLLAQAGVSYAIGRESNGVYGETVNGVQIREHHQFSAPVDPFIVEGDPTSGVLPLVNVRRPGPIGSGDARVQAYNFRVCMTDDPSIRISWQQPEGFKAIDHELACRWFNSAKDGYNEQLGGKPSHLIRKFDPISRHVESRYFKTDTNNHGAVSSDLIGGSYAWAEADYATRERIFQEHHTYQAGYYWFAANDPRVPSAYREAYSNWGLAKDEFVETGGWPHQLYVREARRMVGDYVVTETDTQHRRQADDPVSMGSYNMDSHNCQRFIDFSGERPRVVNEGDVQLPPAAPYAISYRAIVPRASECPNLAVPVCVSASHIAYGSIRMEPVFMQLAEAAAIACCHAIDDSSSLQRVPYDKLRSKLTL